MTRRTLSPSTSPGTETTRRPEIESGFVATHADIVREAAQLLRDADIGRRLPTPVEDLVAAAGLVRGSDEIFAEHVLARAPKELRDAVRGLAGKIRAMLDRREREIYVSPEITHLGRRNFHTLHEVGHEILPWQKKLAYADDDARLSPGTQIRFEREANQVAAELLFQSGFFNEVAAEYAIGMAPIVELAGMFGASIHSAFRRVVETHRAPLCGVVIDCRPATEEPLAYRRYEAVASETWCRRFGQPASWPTVLAQPTYTFLSSAAQANAWSTTARTDWSLKDRDGLETHLHVELFSNQYRTLVLLWVPQRERLKRRRSIAA
jgi:IrrE N-terminal-like domain